MSIRSRASRCAALVLRGCRPGDRDRRAPARAARCARVRPPSDRAQRACRAATGGARRGVRRGRVGDSRGRVLRPLGPRRRAVGQGERAGPRAQDRRRDVPAREQGARGGAPVCRQRPSRRARRSCKSRRGDRDARRAAERHGRDRVAGRGTQPQDRQARCRDHADDAVPRRRGADRRRARRERRRVPAPAAPRRHLLRDAEPAGRGQGDGRSRMRRSSSSSAPRTARTRSASSKWRSRQAPLRCSSTARALSTRTLLVGHEVVGLTAGASTPEELVRATAERLALLGYPTIEEITVAREDVHFRLPREVARA